MTPDRLSPTSTLLTRDRALAGRSKSAAVQQNNAARAELSPRSNSLSPALIAHSRGRTLSAAQRRPYIPTGNMLTEVRTLVVGSPYFWDEFETLVAGCESPAFR